MVSHFTTACLLSQNCLLFQQLPHISVSNAFNLHCFQFSLFSHFVMAKEQNSFLGINYSTILPYRYFIAFLKQMCYHGFTSDMQITIVIKLTGRISSTWDYYDLSRPSSS